MSGPLKKRRIREDGLVLKQQNEPHELTLTRTVNARAVCADRANTKTLSH